MIIFDKGYLHNFILITFLISSFSLQAQEPFYYGGEQAKKLDWTLYYLHKHYVDSIDTERLAELAIIRMFKELDPFSNYQSKAQLDEQQRRDEGIKNDGLGMRYYIINDTATITFIDQGSPAQTGGLLRGDKILAVNDTSIIGKNFHLLNKVLEAVASTEVRLSIKRKGQKNTLAFNLISKSLFAPSIDAAYMIEKNIAYILINRFTQKTIGEFQQAIERLKEQGATQLILDLRNNRGGIVKAATALADEFLEADKLIMYSKGKGLPASKVFSSKNGVFKKGKVCILVNTVTASASEIFLGAMQEWDRALVLGEVTYGKGLIQQSYLLGDSSAVRLTIGRYFTPTGRMLQRPYYFDTSKDWIAQNIANAVHQGDLTSRLSHPDSVAWKTKSGRNILKGQGSIIPDLYLPRRTKDQPILNILNQKRLIYKFIVYHSDKYRSFYQKKYNSGNSFRLDKKIDASLEKHFRSFLTKETNDSALIASLPQPLNKAIITQIKSWIGPQIWESDSYYAAQNENDEVVLRAIKTFSADVFADLKIKN